MSTNMDIEDFAGKPLSLSGNISENWRMFKQNYEIYMQASEKSAESAEVKIKILLRLAGKEAVELFNKFDLSEEDKKNINIVLAKFEAYCNSKKNIVYDRYKFHKRDQLEGESFEQFLTEIQKLSETCEFGTSLDEMVRDRIVIGINDERLRDCLLHESVLDLKKTIDLCRAVEISKEQTQPLQEKWIYQRKRKNSIGKQDLEEDEKCNNENPDEIFKCKICDLEFKEQGHLSNHMLFHNNERHFRCQICYMIFWEKSLYQKHLEDFPAGNCLECSVCRRQFETRSSLFNHKRSVHVVRPFQCKKCPKAFLVSSALEKHELFNHKERAFECDKCGKKLFLESSLKKHLLLHERSRPPPKAQPKYYKCQECDKDFISRKALRKHMRDHTRVKKFPCPLCTMVFARKYQIDKHLKGHSRKPKRKQEVVTADSEYFLKPE